MFGDFSNTLSIFSLGRSYAFVPPGPNLRRRVNRRMAFTPRNPVSAWPNPNLILIDALAARAYQPICSFCFPPAQVFETLGFGKSEFWDSE